MNQTRRQFVRTLFVASQAAAIGSFLPKSLMALSFDHDALPFLVVGDWGRRGEDRQVDVARQMGLEAEALRARFVASVGDNFYEDGVASTTDPQWFDSFENIYTAESLQVPWHSVLGNHDYHASCEAQIDYSKTSKRWKMPARFFKRTESVAPGCEADLLFLDTTPMAEAGDDTQVLGNELKSQNVPAQLEWLEASLAESKARWKIVFAHHPVFSGGVHGDTPFIVDHVLPLLEKYGVQAYFNGHDHDLQHLQAGGVNFFCSGAGSKVRETSDIPFTKFAKGSTSGFLSAVLKPDEMALRMVDWKGRVLYTCKVPATPV